MKTKGANPPLTLKCQRCVRTERCRKGDGAFARRLQHTGILRPLSPSKRRSLGSRLADRDQQHRIRCACGHEFWTVHPDARAFLHRWQEQQEQQMLNSREAEHEQRREFTPALL